MTDVVMWRRLLAEFLGSAFLAAVVIGSGIAAQQLSPGNTGLQLLENVAATGTGLYAIILMFRPRIGCALQPGRVLGGCHLRRGLMEGGVGLSAGSGGWVHRWGSGGQSDVLQNGAHVVDPPPGHASPLLVGGGATLGLVLVIFSLAHNGRPAAPPLPSPPSSRPPTSLPARPASPTRPSPLVACSPTPSLGSHLHRSPVSSPPKL